MVKGETYDKQLFESDAFRHFINIFLNKQSGVTKGCEVTKDAQNITVAAGCFVIQGGLLKETTGTDNAIPTEAGYYKLVYEIDLSKTNNKYEFKQGSYKFVKALGDYPKLIQEDLDNGGTIYQLSFCQFRITETGLQDFKDLRKIIDYGIYVKKAECSYIVATLKTAQEISRGNNFLVKLNVADENGDFFKLNSAGKIEVLKDCMAHLSSKLFVHDCGGEGYVFSKIKVNNNEISSSLERIVNRDYTQSIDSGITYELKKGDIVSLAVDYTSDTGNPKIRSGANATNISISTF